MSAAGERTKLGPALDWKTVTGCSFNPDEPLWRPEYACGAPLAYHVALQADDEPGGVAMVGCCVGHYLNDFRESARGPDYLDSHEVTSFCGMPGAYWLWSWETPPGLCTIEGPQCTCGGSAEVAVAAMLEA